MRSLIVPLVAFVVASLPLVHGSSASDPLDDEEVVFDATALLRTYPPQEDCHDPAADFSGEVLSLGENDLIATIRLTDVSSPLHCGMVDFGLWEYHSAGIQLWEQGGAAYMAASREIFRGLVTECRIVVVSAGDALECTERPAVDADYSASTLVFSLPTHGSVPTFDGGSAPYDLRGRSFDHAVFVATARAVGLPEGYVIARGIDTFQGELTL